MPSDPEGLQRNAERPHLLHVSPGRNLSWPEEDRNLTYTIPSGEGWRSGRSVGSAGVWFGDPRCGVNGSAVFLTALSNVKVFKLCIISEVAFEDILL